MTNLPILRQAGAQHREPMIAAQYAMTADVPIKAVMLDALEGCVGDLRMGSLPIGSVEFVRKAMSLAGIVEPANMSYPATLNPYLRRKVQRRAAGSVLGHWFIKPTTTKEFTGFVFDTLGDPDSLDDHDREQYDVFMGLPPETLVWVSEPVTWQSEYRYYVINGEVRGEGRYDDGPDEAPAPDMAQVREMAWTLYCTPDATAAFGLDVGVLSSGETALIECNDAWALGYYKGTLSHKDYITLLWTRWAQLMEVQV